MEAGDDVNVEGVEINAMSCYDNFGNGEPLIFPFHWCCYELLSKCITGSFDVSKLDKDLLFSIMHELSFGSGRLELNYGVTEGMQQQFWETCPGYELVVSHPQDTPGVAELILSMFGAMAFQPVAADTKLGSRIQRDIFAHLPYDLVYKVVTLLSDKDLLSLINASWPVHALFRNNDQFWRQRLGRTMPWFFELHDLLAQHESLTEAEKPDWKRLYIWAEKTTRPRRWLAGPFMGVANRRHIWGVCEQLRAKYYSRKHPHPEDPIQDFAEKMIQRFSKCSSFVTVSAPETLKIDVSRNTYWLKSWSEIPSRQKVLEVFWDDEDSLAGISLTPNGERRRLVGRDTATEGVRLGHAMSLDEGDWITGLILHIPSLNFGSAKKRHHANPPKDPNGRVHISPKGVTVRNSYSRRLQQRKQRMMLIFKQFMFKSGGKTHVGATDQGYTQRPLLASANWYITGLADLAGEIEGKQKFIRLGLLQAQHPGFSDYSELPEDNTPAEPTTLQSLLWDEDYSHLLGSPIWDHSTLRIICEPRHMGLSSTGTHRDLLPHEALIWARNSEDLHGLKRLSGYVVAGCPILVSNHNGFQERHVDDLCGIMAEYAPSTKLMRRRIGINKNEPGSDLKTPDPWVHFDIDGPGGEMVTEIQYAMHERPKAIKVSLMPPQRPILPPSPQRTTATSPLPKPLSPCGIC